MREVVAHYHRFEMGWNARLRNDQEWNEFFSKPTFSTD
jgi:hypothetical protein